MADNDTYTPELLAFIRSDMAAEAMSSLSIADLQDSNTLATISRLRRHFQQAEASVLLQTARLRQKATTKFPWADKAFFTQESLEQATAWTVALHHAEQIDIAAPPGPVLDLGCGIGGDTFALAQYRHVIAYERNPARLALAQANAHALGLADHIEFHSADWTEDLAAGRLSTASAAYVDPARRINGRRVFSLYEIQPPISEVLKLREVAGIVVAKVMPGVDNNELPVDCSVEFISHEGVCKEAVLWFGDRRRQKRMASVYRDEHWHALAAGGDNPPVGSLSSMSVLYEPDPAVIRTGAFTELCTLLDAHLIDPRIAYIASDHLTETPFAAGFHILEVHPFQLKLLNQRLQALNISRVELKKRSAPFEPESLRPRLKLAAQGRSGVVFFTRIGDSPTMIIGKRPENALE